VTRKTLFAVLIALSFIALLWVSQQFSPPPAPPDLPVDYHALRAAWLGVTWAMDAHTEDEIQALAAELQAHHIRYVFAYVSYLKPDGTFNPTFEHAATFARHFHAIAPGVMLLGWLGIPTQATTPAGHYLENRLESEETRAVIAVFSAQMVREWGFDGIHLDAEPIRTGDPAFINTLQAIRAAIPAESRLSVAVPALQVTQAVTAIPYPRSPYHWTPKYMRLVSDYSDQIAVMAYDSGLFLPADYRAWMAYQVKTAAAGLDGSQTELLIGVPVSEEWTPTHQTHTEYLANALYGVQVALAESMTTRRNVAGIAIYPYWETDVHEWNLLDQFP
jgi:spore germination protein YaaH